jgi:formylglycine-generating enzyme required for sulfatase activity
VAAAVPDPASAFLERLRSLDRRLRAAGFRCTPDRWLAVHDLLLRLAADDSLPADWAALEDWQPLADLIGPLLCRSPAEQQIFREIFKEWATGERASPEEAAGPDASTAGDVNAYRQRTSLRWPASIAALVLALGVAIPLWLDRPSPAPPGETAEPPPVATPGDLPVGSNDVVAAPEALKPQPVPPRQPAPAMTLTRLDWLFRAVRVVLIVLPLAVAAGLVGWRLRRHQVVLSRQRASADDPLTNIRLRPTRRSPFAGSVVLSAARSLRESQGEASHRLDLDATVERTARHAGAFMPVPLRDTLRPEYLMLIDRPRAGDRVPALAQDLLDRLRREHVKVHAYEFDGEPDACRSLDRRERARPVALDGLLARHGAIRLIVVGAPQSLAHPLTGAPPAWLAGFARWPLKVWLTASPVPWGYDERVLAEGGFAVMPLSGQGLDALARWFRPAERRPYTPWFEPADNAFPSLLSSRRYDWLDTRPPAGAALESLEEELRAYLGRKGAMLLTAAAAYPELIWEFTVGLDQRLFPYDEPPVREQRLLRLVRLPWYRAGAMPDYLRKRLLRALDRARFAQVSEAWRGLLEPGPGRVVMTVATPAPLVRRVRRWPGRVGAWVRSRVPRRWLRDQAASPGTSGLPDRVFANVILGRRPGLLNFELPEAIARLLPGRRWPVPEVLAVGVAGAALALGLHLAWGAGLEPWVEAGLLARERAGNASVRVKILVPGDDEENAPTELQRLATTLRATLGAFGYTVPEAERVTFSAEQRRTLPANNLIVHPERRHAAQLGQVASLLEWFTWGLRPETAVVSGDAPDVQATLADLTALGVSAGEPDTLVVLLSRSARTGTVFRDVFGQFGQSAAATPRTFRDPFRDGTGEGPAMVVIPAGTFVMGSPPDEAGRDEDESPQHQVAVPAFAMSRHEVTFEDYDRFATATGRELPSDAGWGRGARPVINVSWDDAVAYADWLSEQTGEAYRLPTEAEWEYAARAGTTTAFALPAPDGSDDIAGQGLANCSNCGSQWDGERTAPVASFAPNAWSLFDMHGNVREWLQDCWHASYRGAPGDGRAWLEADGGDCSRRVLRGGSWDLEPDYVRSALRFRFYPGEADDFAGFRLARTL